MPTDTVVKAPSPPKKFGTFGGGFTSCSLTILGVIMFLRFGQVVGESGIHHAILIVLCAKLITTLTAFSISAVATNTRVEGGVVSVVAPKGQYRYLVAWRQKRKPHAEAGSFAETELRLAGAENSNSRAH